MRPFAVYTAAIAVAFVPLKYANAEDVPWGCEVLLCAASSNPSWHGVPYCVPPMTKLIAAMKLPGFSWPICLSSGTGEPGHEPYEECPAGSEAFAYNGGGNRSDNLNMCRKIVDRCLEDPTWKSRDNACEQIVETERPRRADPYYFDIPDENGQTSRFWFNLNP